MHEAIIALICILVYWRTIYFQYVGDDLSVRMETMRRIKQEGLNPKPPWWRMIGEQLVGANYYHSQSTHLLNIVIHVTVSALVCNLFGFIPGLLFAILPLNNEISMCPSGKWYGVATIIILLAWKFPLLAPLAFIIPGRFITVIGLPAPLLFLLKPGYWYMSVLVIAVFLLSRRMIFDPKGVKQSAHCNHKEAWAIAPRKLIIAFKFYGYYFVQGIFGFKCAQFHSYNSQFLADIEGTEKAHKKLDIFFWVGFSLVMFLIYWTLFNPIKPGKWAFGLWWFTIAIAPFFNIISVGNMLIAMRYSYLANIGLVIFLAHIPYAWIALAGWYLARTLSIMTQYKNDYWSNVFQLVEEPGYFQSWILWGNMNFARGHVWAALQDWTQAADCNPRNFKVHFNLSTAFCAINDIPHAIEALEEAKKWDLYGQEGTRDSIIAEREKLIVAMCCAQQQSKRLQIDLTTIPFMA